MTPLQSRIAHDIGDFADLIVSRAALRPEERFKNKAGSPTREVGTPSTPRRRDGSNVVSADK